MATKNLSSYNISTLPKGKGKRVGLVVSEWNTEITSNLAQGASELLLKAGVAQKDIILQEVPGSFELVYGCKHMIQNQEVDAVIAIGSVIEGETRHFDFVCQGVSNGIAQLNVAYDTPVIFCVLTDHTLQQAKDRSGGKLGNKGIECAIAALKMIALEKQ